MVSNAHRTLPRMFATLLACCYAMPGTAEKISSAISTEIVFNRDVRPILSENCFACHGPDEHARRADLRLDTANGALAVISPDDPSASMLMERITTADPDQRMPPTDSGKQLSAQQIKVIGRWIVQGANWQPHWSFIAPEKILLPDIANDTWMQTPIDAFVLARLWRESANTWL